MAAVHHGDPVAQHQHFVQVIRDHQHRSAGIARGDQLALHIGHRANVQAPGRLVGDDEAWRFPARGHQGAAENQLLHVAARQRPGRCVGATAAHIKGLHHPHRMGARSLLPHPQPARESPAAQALRHRVFPNRQIAHQAHGLALFGNAGHALRHQPARRRPQRHAQETHLPGHCRVRAAQQLGQRHLAIARHARNGHNLAAAQRQRDLLQAVLPGRRGADRRQQADLGTGNLRRAAQRRRKRMAHHPLRQFGLAGVRRAHLGHQAAIAEHGNPRRYPQHLAQFVADENDRQPLPHHLSQHVKQGFGLGRRQHGGGFVEYQDACAPVQRLENFHTLAFTDRQAADAGLGLHRQPEAPGHAEQPLAPGAAPRERLPQRLGTHHHVVQHAQVVGQREVLVHHAYARRQRRLGVARRQRLPKRFNPACIGPVMAKQDGHQRRFARAVLAQQGQHLAGPELQRDVVIGKQGAEPLGDAAQRENGIGHGVSSKENAPAQSVLQFACRLLGA